MAINFTVSYTFSPNTTIASAQVNTNTSDVGNVFTGLEALTKTFAKLKVDVDPTTSLEVATKAYVDHYSAYRRPVLQYSSSTVVNLETGITGTSGQAQILFPDGNLRTDSTSARINCNLAQVAALSGTAQSGLRTGTVTNNTWYAIYAVKTSDNTSNFVAVADTVLPLQANYATLNSNFGTSSWVYIGMIRYGDNSGTANAILSFRQAGHLTSFVNTATGAALNCPGIRLATGTAASVTWAYASGTGAAQVPGHIFLGTCTGTTSSSANNVRFEIDSSVSGNYRVWTVAAPAASSGFSSGPIPLSNGLGVAVSSGSVTADVFLTGFVDQVLGVGSNAIL